MVPYSYNMVDMGGIDLAEANGTVVPGVYERITEAMNLCGDVILYNWKFAGIGIVPSAYAILQQTSSILINGMIQVTELDEVTVLAIEPPPPPLEPVIPLSVDDNGVYSIDPPQSGYNPVTVALQFTELSVTENGEYTPESPYRGFSSVSVDVHDVVFLSGTNLPSSSIGEDGDIYLLLVNPDYEYDISLGWSCLKEYYVKSTSQKLSTHSSAFYKTVEGGCIAVEWGPSSGGYYGPLLLSTVADYVKYTANNSVLGSVDIDGVTWYYNGGSNWSRSRDSNASIPSFASSTHDTAADIPSILQAAHYSPGSQGNATTVVAAYIKVSGAWQNLIGSNINDILQEE